MCPISARLPRIHSRLGRRHNPEKTKSWDQLSVVITSGFAVLPENELMFLFVCMFVCLLFCFSVIYMFSAAPFAEEKSLAFQMNTVHKP